MLGEKIDDLVGKTTGLRCVPGPNGDTVIETSFSGQGRLLGIDCTEMGTYQSVLTPAGILNGEGQGVAMSANGDTLTWKAHGVGRQTANGGTSYRYSLVMQSTSTKWARLNGLLGVGEWEVDAQGNAKGQLFEWR